LSGERILVVEDDDAIRCGLVDALSIAGYDVAEEQNGKEALERIRGSAGLDLVLLDVMLPGCDGFEVLHEARRLKPTLPVIMVTARGAEADRVRGLSDGADDYVVKPFNARELLARVGAVLRRSPGRSNPLRALIADGIRIDLDRREVRLADGGCSDLTEREAEILRYLAAHRDRAVERNEMLRHLWGVNARRTSTRTLDMHVSRLRDKLGGGEACIETVRSIGYKLSDRLQPEERAETEGP